MELLVNGTLQIFDDHIYEPFQGHWALTVTDVLYESESLDDRSMHGLYNVYVT